MNTPFLVHQLITALQKHSPEAIVVVQTCPGISNHVNSPIAITTGHQTPEEHDPELDTIDPDDQVVVIQLSLETACCEEIVIDDEAQVEL